MGNAHAKKPHATYEQRHNPRPVAFMAQAHTEGEEDHYRRKAAGLVLFVCTSNTCRSPMAEFAARKWCVSSAPLQRTALSSTSCPCRPRSPS